MAQDPDPMGPFCQSCAMPLAKPEDFGTTAEGWRQNDFCHYCDEEGKFPQPDIPPGEDIEHRKVGMNSLYILYRGGVPDAVISWEGRHALEAQRDLDRRSFARCHRRDCGVRVAKLGDDCGNHR